MPAKDDMESRLRAALTAGEPSAGFAARTAARAVRAATPPAPTIRRRTRWLWVAAVVVLAAATMLGAWRYWQRQQTAAAQQLQTALAFTNAQVSHITSVALRHATRHFDSRQLGSATSRAGARCRQSKPAHKRPAGATQRKVASHQETP